jgi:DNA-binding XRE family transcriptional regulator
MQRTNEVPDMPLRSRNASDKFLTGQEVRAFRVSRQLTQPELAKWLGLTPQAVGKYESRGVTKATALAFAAIDRGLKPFKPTKDEMDTVTARKKRKINNGHGQV